MLRSLRGFVPWIAFAIVAGYADWRAGGLVALVVAVLLLLDGLRTGHHLDEAVIETSAALFFVVLTVVAFAAPHAAIQHHTGAVAMAWLAVTAWGSLAVRRPFTLGIARRGVPREFWDSPLFYRANATITAVWAAAFTVAACLQALVTSTAGAVIIQVAGFVVPAAYTVRYQRTHSAPAH